MTKKNVPISSKETLEFLNKASSYSKFQIWLGDLQERDYQRLIELKHFYLEHQIESLMIFDSQQNYDKNNLANIDKMIEKTKLESVYGMQVDEIGNRRTPTITKESRKASQIVS